MSVELDHRPVAVAVHRAVRIGKDRPHPLQYPAGALYDKSGPADDHIRYSLIQILETMEHADAIVIRGFDETFFGKGRIDTVVPLVVPTHGDGFRDMTELVEYFLRRNISGVKDEIGIMENIDDLGI